LVLLVIVGVMIVSTWLVPLPVRAAIADQPYWLQIVEIIVIADLGIYFVHRMFHSIPLLWRFHQIHHSSEELDWLAAYRVHPVEQIAFRGISLAPIFALGFSDAAIAVSQYLTNGNRFSSIPISASALGHCVGLSHRHNSITGITARTSTRATRISQRNSRCWISCPAAHLPGNAVPTKYGIDEALPPTYVTQLLHPFKGVVRRPVAAGRRRCAVVRGTSPAASKKVFAPLFHCWRP
jgi:hypothetical protein